MEINTLADTYVNLVKQGKYIELIEAHYSEDAESIESIPAPGQPRTTKGRDAIRHKNLAFDEMHEVHAHTISEAWPHGEEKFAVQMSFDMTHLPSGMRRQVEEIAVLTVSDGKICREEFFYRS